MCRVCQFKEMSQEELGRVLRPILAKVNEHLPLTAEEGNDLAAYGALLESLLAEARVEALAVKTVAARLVAQVMTSELPPVMESTDEEDEAILNETLRKLLKDIDLGN